MRLFVLLAVGATLLAALASGAILFGLGPSRDGASGSSAPVKVIVENRGRHAAQPPPVQDAGAALPDAGRFPPEAGPEPADSSATPDAAPATKVHAPALRPLDGRRVTRTLMSRRGALLGCFQRGGAASTKVKNVVIRLEVGGDGQVHWAKVEPASVQSSPMGKCLAAVAAKTRFPRHPAEALVFRVPIAVSLE